MMQLQHSLLFFFSFLTFSSAAQWTAVEWAEEDVITNIDFVDDVTGYAQMQLLQGFTSSFEKTTDGGQTWFDIAVPVDVPNIQNMDFLADGTGALITRVFSDGNYLTQVFRTFDDGTNWEDISPENAAIGYGTAEIQMLNANTLFFVTDDYFYRTVDGGTNWSSVLLPAAGMSVHFSDEDHGVVGTWDGTFNYFGGMHCTTDGGATWNETALEVNQTVIGVVKQFGQSTALAAPVDWGANVQNHFYKTSDNGLTWDEISLPETGDNATLSGFDFINETTGVITLASNDQFYIFNTTDGGASWVLQNQFEQLYLTDLDLTPNSGYLASENGLLLRLDTPNNIDEFEDISIAAYPNPMTSGQLLRWNSNQHFTEIRMTDSAGKMVFQENLTVQSVSLPNLKCGFYFVTLQDGLISLTTKVLVY